MKKYAVLTLLIVLLLLTFRRSTSFRYKEPPLKNVRLVVFLVVDQFPSEYLDRFLPYASSGFKELFERGVVYDNAHHDHGVTATCQGHAALATGTYPHTNGIVGNYWFDREKGKHLYCVDDPTYDRSPRNIYVSGLGEWLKDRHGEEARVFAVSGKDRSAIVLGGKQADAAFWYQDGHMRSSNYYPEENTRAEWLSSFHGEQHVQRLFGSLWEPLPFSDEVLARAGIKELDEGLFPDTFPHPLGLPTTRPEAKFYEAVGDSPFVDDITGAFAERLIEEENLGGDQVPDFIGISFSALDRVGHRYGPHSREVFDTFMRLDRTLGRLLAFLKKRVGMNHVLLVLSSDHGVQHYPEELSAEGFQAHRLSAQDIACIQSVYRDMIEEYGRNIFVADGYLNYHTLSELDVLEKDVVSRVVNELESCPIVKKVWIPSHFKRCETSSDPAVCQLYSRAYDPHRSPDFILQPERNYLHWYRTGTGHGSPYDYDSRVPVVFYHPDFVVSDTNSEEISVVDIAPTLAELLALRTLSTVEGRALNLLD